MNITVVGAPELSARLSRVAANIGKMLPEFQLVGEELKHFYETVPFLSQGTIYGAGWEPLNPKYKAWKENHWRGKGILVESGKMMDSFAYKANEVSVVIYNESKLFEYHQMGTTKMPQRIMMKLDTDRKTLVIDTISKSLRERINAAWAL